jgi:hypothetical protein
MNFVSELTPDYESSVFVVKRFSTQRYSGQCLYSEPMFASGLFWRLKLYAGGNGSIHSNYLSVFIEILSGLVDKTAYQYRVELVFIILIFRFQLILFLAKDFQENLFLFILPLIVGAGIAFILSTV